MKKNQKLPLFKGFLTGMMLQLAIGPVFFYLLGITITSDFVSGFSGVVAVTLVDYIYIALSILGIGSLLEKERIKKIFSVVSSFILVGFGVQFILSSSIDKSLNPENVAHVWTPFSSFISCFVLTISSPLTILFWGSMFSAKATENQFTKKQLMHFAIGAGLSTWIFLSVAMFLLSLFRATIPNFLIQVLNIIVGVILAVYGITRILKAIWKKGRQEIA